MRALWDRLQIAWCAALHPEVTWPMRGRYQCRRCHRSYAVAWEQAEARPPAPARGRAAEAGPLAAGV